ncbi:antirestriction protein [Limnohabitans sp.]|uniref:antirestriction protein n=1 Tax=Limnohabitans sp. TaxID=1907725 RepID=UPI00311E6F5B
MTTPTIINTIVPESERMNIVDGLFGMSYMLKLEPVVFSIAEALAESYKGAYWEFHDLSNGGWYMAPRHDTEFTVSCENGFDGKLSPDAFGITACLYAFSELSFAGDRMARTCATQYHLLREYVAGHPEARSIYRAID